MSDAPTVLIHPHEGWRSIVLNRPEKLNALNERMLEGLSGAIDSAEADRGCRAILLTGAGRAFCSGQELSAAIISSAAGPPELGPIAEAYHQRLVRRVRASPLPVIAAVNGMAAGAGASLALACDIVIAGESAAFLQAFVRIGLVVDCGGSFFLPRLIGDARARAIAMLGEPVSARQAESWGMIWRAVDDATLMADAEALAAKLAAGPAHALALIKRQFAASSGNTLEAQLDLERDLQAEAGRGDDYAEGVRAFLEKRKPRFPGR